MESEIIVGIDVGSHKVCALVGEAAGQDDLRIIGVGVCPTHGMRRGMVVNVDDVAGCVVTAIERAERVSGYEIRSAQAAVTDHLSSANSRGVVAVAQSDHEIGSDDVARAIDGARAIAIPNNRELIHVLPRHYIVDGQDGVPDPVSMFGFRLEVEAHIVTGATTSMQNLERALRKAEVDVQDMVAAPLAAAEAVVTQDEKDIGVLVADIGGGTTGVCIFVDGAPWHTTVLPVGGTHLTNDITVGLRLPFAAAEELKVRYGHALANTVDPDEMLDVPGGGRDGAKISRRQLCEIIEDRVAEIFALILNEIKRSGHEGLLPGGIVLTGGTVELPGIADLGREVLGLPVRVGVPQGFGGLADNISGPAYATSIGLLQWARRHRDERAPTPGRPSFSGFGDWVGKIIKWFKKAFLPG